jgi:hypothetical protein
VSLAPGASANVTVTMRATAGADRGHQQAYLDISQGGTSLAHAALFTLLK